MIQGTGHPSTGAAPPLRAMHLTCVPMMMAMAATAAMAVHASAAAADDPQGKPPAPKLIDPSLTYDGTLLGNAHGGVRTGATYVGNLHLKLTADGAAVGMPGTAAYVDVLTIHGGRPVTLVGDAQSVSSLAGPNGTQVEEFWVQHNWAGSSTSLLAGIYDLNSEFYKLRAAGLFLASPFGIGAEFAQSGADGPSIFPRTSAGIRFAFKPTPQTVFRTAVLDGVPVVRADGSRALFKRGDGLLTVAEFAILFRADGSADTGADEQAYARDRIGRLSSLPPYENKLAMGAWRYSGRFADLSDADLPGNPTSHRGSTGAYAIGEHLLVGNRKSTARRLAGFAQAGIADSRVNRFDSYIGAGIVGSGWAMMRESDQFGLSVARAHNGSHYTRAQLAQASRSPQRAETTFEMTYLTHVSEHLTVQPALQYVVHPNTDPALANAWVLQLRFEVGY